MAQTIFEPAFVPATVGELKNALSIGTISRKAFLTAGLN